jgi:SAM-dependent methyltransferase
MEKIIEYWKSEEKRVFKGWNFDSIESKMFEEELPWSYRQLVNSYLSTDAVLLDMGTGGGEFLLSLNYPKMIFATEGYKPNYNYAKRILADRGIKLSFVVGLKLPYPDDMFDIIINRHESYDIDEINRVLKPGGVFITQQVGGKNNLDFTENVMMIQRPLNDSFFSMKSESDKFVRKKFKVLFEDEYFPLLKFYDIGAFVYYAKIIEWEFPNFSVESHIDILKELYSQIKIKGFIQMEEHRFIILCKKVG